jgi:KAP family P-loop domain
MTTILVKSKNPDIMRSDPWADDVFERKIIGERLTRLIVNTPENFVLALKAPFGTGKSVFLDRLSKHIESSVDSMPVVSLNAWENDHHVDPMEALLVALSDRVFKIKKQTTKDGAIATINKLISYAVPVMKFTARTALAVKTIGLSEAGVMLATELAEADTTGVEIGLQLLKKANKRKSDIAEFRKNLQEVRLKLLKDCRNESGKLIFVIDELDRCRPDFAIKMLERIKHFFNEEGIAFVLALDNDNLSSAVQTLYGPNADGERYLRKFFDMEFFLPPVTPIKIIMHLMVEHGHVISGGVQALEGDISLERQATRIPDLKKYDSPTIPSFALALADLSLAYELSIRDLTQIMTAMTAIIRSCPPTQPLAPYLLCLGFVCRYVDPKGFTRVIWSNGFKCLV